MKILKNKYQSIELKELLKEKLSEQIIDTIEEISFEESEINTPGIHFKVNKTGCIFGLLISIPWRKFVTLCGIIIAILSYLVFDIDWLVPLFEAAIK